MRASRRGSLRSGPTREGGGRSTSSCRIARVRVASVRRRSEVTSMYAVVDPATGETVKEYPTITDDELRDAVARADRAHREWSRVATVADRASLVRRVGELHSERR